VKKMKMQIKRFSECTGVSVRTLHYYDQIGLLKPAEVDERTGYRLYDEACFARMQQILFFRELDLPLKTICEILSAPGYDAAEALLAQRELLRRKKERLERLITAVDEALQGGTMNMTALAKNDFEQYKAHNLGAVHVHPNVARRRIYETAKAALEDFKANTDKFKPFCPEAPFVREEWFRRWDSIGAHKKIQRHDSDLVAVYTAPQEILPEGEYELPY